MTGDWWQLHAYQLLATTSDDAAHSLEEFCAQHSLDMSGMNSVDVERLVTNLWKVEKGLNLNEEEESWAVQQAFKHREQLAFSKRELGLCSATTFEMNLKNPEQNPIG